jgi:hypothetical protein
MSVVARGPARAAPYLFDDFVPGCMLGEATCTYDDAMAAGWRSIFGADGPPGLEAAGVALALMMRGYLSVVAPRPPGNVHASQRLHLSALPRPGEQVRTRVACAGKEIRRERRYVDIDVSATGTDQRPLFAGRLTLVWAA